MPPPPSYLPTTILILTYLTPSTPTSLPTCSSIICDDLKYHFCHPLISPNCCSDSIILFVHISSTIHLSSAKTYIYIPVKSPSSSIALFIPYTVEQFTPFTHSLFVKCFINLLTYVTNINTKAKKTNLLER